MLARSQVRRASRLSRMRARTMFEHSSREVLRASQRSFDKIANQFAGTSLGAARLVLQLTRKQQIESTMSWRSPRVARTANGSTKQAAISVSSSPETRRAFLVHFATPLSARLHHFAPLVGVVRRTRRRFVFFGRVSRFLFSYESLLSSPVVRLAKTEGGRPSRTRSSILALTTASRRVLRETPSRHRSSCAFHWKVVAAICIIVLRINLPKIVKLRCTYIFYEPTNMTSSCHVR